MSNVITFPRPDIAPRHLLVETCWAPSQRSAGIGIRKYFISVIEPDGSAACVWEGTSHREALDEAYLWDLPIADMVIGGAA